MKTEQQNLLIGQIVSIPSTNKSRVDNTGKSNWGSDTDLTTLAAAMAEGYDTSRGLIQVTPCSKAEWQSGYDAVTIRPDAIKIQMGDDDTPPIPITNEQQLITRSLLYMPEAPDVCYRVVTGHRRLTTWILAQSIRRELKLDLESELQCMVVTGTAQELLELNISENETKAIGALATSWAQKINNARALFSAGRIQADFRRIYGAGTGTKIYYACKVLAELPASTVSTLDLNIAKSWDKEALREHAKDLEKINTVVAASKPDKRDSAADYASGLVDDVVAKLTTTAEKGKAIGKAQMLKLLPDMHKSIQQIFGLYFNADIAGLKAWPMDKVDVVEPVAEPVPEPADVIAHRILTKPKPKAKAKA